MSPETSIQYLEKAQIIDAKGAERLRRHETRRLFSVYWELRTLLYAGITLFTTGAGWLIYENIDQIGHSVLLGALALLCAACFGYAYRYRTPYRPEQTRSKTVFGDYALLLGCLLFLVLEGYAQYQYTIFGTRYGLVTFLPAVLFLFLAYAFDHRGVLSLGLTALISWVGVTIRPLDFYFRGNLRDLGVLTSALLLSAGLITAAIALDRRGIKRHFTDTTLGFSGNLLFVSLVAGLFNFPEYHWLIAPALVLACLALDRYARTRNSFLFILMSTLYGYIGLTYLIFHYIPLADDLSYFYWLISGVALVAYLLSYGRKK